MSVRARNLQRLFDVSGRESRRSFWTWTVNVVVILALLTFIEIVPPMVNLLVTVWRTITDHHGMGMDMGDPSSGGGYLLLCYAVSTGVTIVLFAGAVVRRLHDRNISGWWVAPYLLVVASLPGLAASFVPHLSAPGLVQADTGLTTMLAGLFLLLQPVAVVGAVVLAVLLALPGGREENRFGAPPDRDNTRP